jgi:hypothetical protein
VSSVLLKGRSGRTKLDVLARLLGLLSAASRVGSGPKDNLLIPEVDNLATCFVDGVSSPPPPIEDPLAVLPPVLFLLLIVTLGGM